MSAIWTPQPGPQTATLLAEADEILVGGARGGGKTIGGILWLTKGNPRLPADHPCYQTALNYSRYVGLVVRRHRQDLRDWIDQAEEIFKDTGAELSGNPPIFMWPHSGAKIYVDHLNDEEAFSKYRGWNISRLLLEELTEIPHRKWYLKLLGSLRSKRDESGLQIVPPQALATTNPDGPGHTWVKKRFIDVYTSKGGQALRLINGKFSMSRIEPGKIPPGTYIVDPVSKMTRVFIPALLDDNKYLGEEYERNILAQKSESEAIYLAWRYGRWDVFSGQFFDKLRFDGPMPGEEALKYPYANHTYDAADMDLAPWWPMAIGTDWGYNHEAATYWGKHNPNDKRTYVYREHVVRGVGSRQLGQQIAEKTLPDLIGLEDNSPHIPLFLSHDAFSKEDNTKTRAALFAEGVDDVLGQNSAHLVELTDTDRKLPPEESYELVHNRYVELSSGPCITIHRARQDRAAMATYLRELLSWHVMEPRSPDMIYAQMLLSDPNGNGLQMYEDYMDKFRNQHQDPVPRIKFERGLIRLRDCLTSLVYDEDNTEVPKKIDSTPSGEPGDDPYDGLCHLVMGMRFNAYRVPRRVFVGDRLNKLKKTHGDNPDPALVGQVLGRANQDWDKIKKAWDAFSLDDLRM